MNAPKVVFVANAKTNQADAWILNGEVEAFYLGKPETLCTLSKGDKSCTLPKRCVFETEDEALAALRK